MDIERDLLEGLARDSPSLSLFLRAVQARFNWIPPEALELGADQFGQSYMRVYEQAAFTPGFSLEERGKAVIEVCHGLACREAGSEGVMRALEAKSGLRAGQTSEDASLTICRQSCFGRCAIGPNVRVRGVFRANQTPGDADALLKNALRTS